MSEYIDIDLDKHIMISKEMENVIRKHLSERCPIAEFAKSHGYLDIMPAFCNSDYSAIEYINAALIRKHTCANIDICDYWIVGDRRKVWQIKFRMHMNCRKIYMMMC